MLQQDNSLPFQIICNENVKTVIRNNCLGEAAPFIIQMDVIYSITELYVRVSISITLMINDSVVVIVAD